MKDSHALSCRVVPFRPVASRVSLLALIAFLCVSSIYAQSFFGSIVGTVSDSTGASVPGAAVEVTNASTGDKRTASTDTNGAYQFVNLVPGVYSISIGKTGFKQFKTDSVPVAVQAAVRIDAAMQIGDVSQTVEVTTAAPLLETESSSLGQVVEERKVQEMPLNGRNPLNLVALIPGVIAQGGTSGNPAQANNTALGNYQINGAFGGQSAQYLDGGPLNVNYINSVGFVPSQETVQEFRVQTNSLNAEFGRFAGGLINLTTKSGTNTFHGSAYEFLRNRVLNANTFFNNRNGTPRQAFTQNQYGVSLGGPVVKNKTFFFFGYEGFRVRSGAGLNASVPSAAMKSGNFAGVADIYDPLSTCGVLGNPACAVGPNGPIITRTLFPGNVIPVNRLDPTSVALAKFWPDPNRAGLTSNFARSFANGNDNDHWDIRGDQNIRDNQRVFARYSYWPGTSQPNDPYGSKIGSQSSSLSHQAVVGDTYTLSPTTVLDVRLAFLRYGLDTLPMTLGTNLTSIGWPASLGSSLLYSPLPSISAPPYNSPQAVLVIIARNNSYSLTPSLTKIVGRHSIKFGAELRRMDFNFVQTNGPAGIFNFDNVITAQNPLAPTGSGNGFASFMLGYGSSGAATTTTNSQTQVAETGGRMFYQGYYVQDTFQVRRRLTLNYGVRWDLPGEWTERHDQLAVWQPDAINPILQNAKLPYTGNAVLVGSPGYSDRTSYANHYKLFAPRVGFAYRLTDSIVVRGGYGIFFPPSDVAFSSSPWYSPVTTFTSAWASTLDGGITPNYRLNNPFPNGIPQPPGHNQSVANSILLGGSFYVPVPKQAFPYMQQWNFSVGHQFKNGAAIDIAYAGAKGTHLPMYAINLNQLNPSYLSQGSALTTLVDNPLRPVIVTSSPLSGAKVSAGQLLRPYPQYNSLSAGAPTLGDSNYHSLQFKFEKRFGGGGTLLASYSWAKLISNTDSLLSWLDTLGGAFLGPQNSYDLKSERSLVSNDVPNHVTISYVYDLPFGKGKHFLGSTNGVAEKLISGWGFNGITNFQTGYPLSFTNLANTANAFNPYLRPNVVAGCDKSTSGSAQQRYTAWFNKSCFTAPPSFTFGNESRTDPNLRGPGISNWDIALFKNTSITETARLQFRAEVFNLANRVQFGGPNTTVGNPLFGQITTQANQPRLIQLALRLAF